jgi:tetratricopeptide (TPR) repeat protein
MNASAPAHPDLDQLVAFSQGTLDDASATRVEDHLSNCDPCCRALEVAPDSPLIALLRRVANVSGHHLSADCATPKGFEAGYELLAELGRGGMGVVYRAKHRTLGRDVALKMVRAAALADPREWVRFRREAEAAARLRHPHVIQVYEVGTWTGTDGTAVPFIAMELADGGSLAERLAAGPLSAAAAAELVEPLAQAVQHAHESGVLHRDLKPANVLLASGGADATPLAGLIPKVSDFGLAKCLDAPAGPTRSGALLGTPSYMASEQAAGRIDLIGPAADVYSLGAILYECLTARPPFRAASDWETLRQVQADEPPPPRRLQPGVPRDLETVCLKCLDKDPRRRYASAGDLVADLGRYRRGEPVLARPVGRVVRVLKWARRRPAAAVAIGIAAVGGVGLVAGVLAHNSRLRVEIDRTAAMAQVAGDQRQQAEASYRSARAAVQRMLTDFSDPRFTGIPRLTELRRRQAEDALAFYDEVLSQADPDSTEVRIDTARALAEAASLQIPLGRLGPAGDNLRRALSLVESIGTDDSEGQTAQRLRLECLSKLGTLEEALFLSDPAAASRHAERAIDYFRKAITLAEQLVADAPDSPDAQGHLAWSCHNLGSILQRSGRPDQAEPHCRRAMAIRERLLRDHPDHVGLRVQLAENRLNLGQIDAQTGRTAEAEALFGLAEDALKTVARDHPLADGAAVSLAALCVNWGNLLAITGRPDLALARFAEGLRVVGELYSREPSNGDARGMMLTLHGARAVALGKTGRFREAIPDWDRVVELTGESSRRGHRLSRLDMLARSGEHIRSATEAAALTAGASAEEQYNLACALSLAAAAAGDDTGLAQPDRQARADEAAKQAVHLLGMAAAAGYFREPAAAIHFHSDGDLSALRNRADFRQLLDKWPAPR